MIKVFEIKIRNSEIDSCNKKKKKKFDKIQYRIIKFKIFLIL